MKRFMLFIALGLAATEKLDRTYLPPPGSKYAGGEPGDLQVPLEFPKKAYTTTGSPIPGKKINERPSFEDTRLVPGTLRGSGQDFSTTTPVTPSSQFPFNYFQSKVPTTTTSYAFTQTTTFPPNEGFETTLSPIFPVEGPLGEQPGFINQPFGQGQNFNQIAGQNRPSFAQPINQLSKKPGFLPISNVFGGQTSFPGSQGLDGRPVYTQAQNINQNQQNVPVSTTSSIGSGLQQGLVTSHPNSQGYTQHLGVQPPRQFNQQGYFPSSTATPNYQTGIPSQYDGNISNIHGQQPSGYPLNGPSSYFPSSTAAPGYQAGFPSQYNGQISNIQTTKENGQLPSGYPSNGPQGSPSSTATPGYQAGIPSQYDGDISNIETTKVNDQLPSGYPSSGPQGYSPSSTSAPGYQTNFPTQSNGVTPNIQTTKFNGQQPSDYPTNRPQQSTTQYIDKYGNVQNNVVPGFSVPHQKQQGQSPSPQSGLTQFEPQGHQVSHETSDTGFTHVQQQGVSRPQYIDQKGSFLTSTPSQGTNIPGTSGAQRQGGQQFVGQQEPHFPTTSSGGISSNQGYQHPQFVNQQGNFPSNEISQSTPITGTSLNQPQRTQRPEYGTQQNLYPSSGFSQKVNPQTISQGSRQPQQQLGGQQGLYPSSPAPGQIGANQQSGQPQFIEKQGAIVPGQFNYQQPESQSPQIIGQQNLLPFDGTSQGYSIPGQTNTQQTQLNPQTFQTTGFVNGLPLKQGGNVNTVLDNIPPGINAPGQKQFNENFPSTGAVTFGQPQVTDGRVPSQYPKPGDQRIITDGRLNNKRPGSAAVPSDYQQPFITSTTPSSIPSYTTPGRVYPSTTSPLLENDLRGKRPGIITSRPERPQAESDRNAVILNYENVLTPEGFAYSFDTSNGIHADENGTAINGVKANGSYSYVGDDGKLYSVVYTADENGFRPHGDHLPTPPPVPKAIQQVIEQATKDKEAGISHDGFYDDEKYGHKKYQFPKHRHPETQNKVIDGEYGNNDRNNKNKITLNEDRKNVATYDKNPSEVVYDNSKYDIDDDMTETDMDGKIRKQFNRKNLSRRPVNKIPGKNIFEVKQEHDSITHEQPQLTGQNSEQRRPFGPEKESPRRRPGTSSHKGKPVFSKDQYDNRQNNYDNKFSEEEEDLGYGPDEDEKRIPSKTTGTKYSGFEGESQQTNDDELQFPGRLETKKQSDAGVRRPISHGTQSVKSFDGPKQTSIKGTHPQKPFKDNSKIFDTRYQVSDDSSSDQNNYEEPEFYDQENQDISGVKAMGPTYTRNEFTYKQKPGINYKENAVDKLKTKYPTDTRSKQKGETFYDQQRNENDNRNIPEQSDNEETGYQYNPPQNKFNLGEKDRFPTRFSDKAITETPVSKYEMSDKKTTVQPFITPNVHRDDDGSYEDVSEENRNSKESGKMTSKIPEYRTTEDSSEYFDEQSEPEHQLDKEYESSDEIRPVKPGKTTSVYRPGYQSQGTTGKPEYYYDDNTTEKKRKMPKPSSKRPENSRYPSNFEKQGTQGEPEQDYSEDTVEAKKPSFTYTSSTTPIPSRPVYKQTSPQGQPKFSTTYEPSDTSSTEEDYNEDVTKPGYTDSKSSPRRPVTSSSSISSTTPSTMHSDASRTKITPSRPFYDYSSDRTMIPESPTIRPGISESAFGKPLLRPGGSRKPSYPTSTPIRPNYNEDYDGKNPEGGSFYSVPEGSNYPKTTINELATPESNISQNLGQFGRKDVPSTTYRPNYSITSISQPSSVAVDTFGRPLRPVPGGGTTQPRVPVSSSQETPSNVSQDTGVRPEQVTFKPSEVRFGGAVQRIPGQKPAEFGPSSFTTPGYLEPYGPATGKIIGEDFSGPKQQQKYDPETGYYY